MIINFINYSGLVSHAEMTRTVYEIISRTVLKIKLLRSLDVQGQYLYVGKEVGKVFRFRRG